MAVINNVVLVCILRLHMSFKCVDHVRWFNVFILCPSHSFNIRNMVQLDNLCSSGKAFIDIRSSSIPLLQEGDNSLFFTGKEDSGFTVVNNKRAFNDDLYLLLLVYVRCFCAPVFPIIILNILNRYRISEQDIFDVNPRIYIFENISFTESKIFLSVFFLLSERVNKIQFDLHVSILTVSL